MNEPKDDPRSARLLALAAEAFETVESAERARDARPLEVGDLAAVPGCGGEDGIEWALLARDGDRALLAPADHAPYEGDGGDIRAGVVAAGEGGAALWLRPRWSRWLPAAALEGAIASGAITPAAVAEARARAERALAAEPPGPPELGAGAPGYRAWVERAVLPARAALDGLAAAPPTAAVARPAFGSAASPPGPTPRAARWRPLALLAASLLLAAAAFLFLGRGGAPAPGVIADASYLFLHPAGSLRGDGEAALEGVASLVLLVALVPPGLDAPALDLELLRAGEMPDGARAIWRGQGPVSADGEVRVAVPARLLPPGRYRLRAHAAGADTALEYRFEVARTDRSGRR